MCARCVMYAAACAASSLLQYLKKLRTHHLHKPRSEPTKMLLLRCSFGLWDVKSQLPRRPSILVLSVLLTASLMCVSEHLLSCPPSSLLISTSLHHMPPGRSHAHGDLLLLMCTWGDRLFVMRPPRRVCAHLPEWIKTAPVALGQQSWQNNTAAGRC